MRKTIRTITVIAALAISPSAAAAGPNLGALEGAGGVESVGAGVRYVTIPSGLSTALAAIRTSDGRVLRFGFLPGTWGVPVVTLRGGTGGLSRDGRTLVLSNASQQSAALRAETHIAILDARTFTTHQLIRLRGDFAFDALAPGAQTLYLIQHVSNQDLTRYRVRAYDLSSGRLLPRAIADKRQRGWVMAGYPVARSTSRDGRWVYTLYQRNGGYPFVHALDAVHRTAVCVGIPWPQSKSQDPLAKGLMRLDEKSRTLTIQSADGRRFVLDTRTLRIARPQVQGSSAGMFGGLAGAAAGILVLVTLAVRRRLVRPGRASISSVLGGRSAPR